MGIPSKCEAFARANYDLAVYPLIVYIFFVDYARIFKFVVFLLTTMRMCALDAARHTTAT
jgi:hypothetical protein